jgi:hypothetical protein
MTVRRQDSCISNQLSIPPSHGTQKNPPYTPSQLHPSQAKIEEKARVCLLIPDEVNQAMVRVQIKLEMQIRKTRLPPKHERTKSLPSFLETEIT